MKAKPCPNCGNTELDIGDCGYSSFNVAWVKCPKCTLECKESCCDDAVPSWNQWCKDPIKELLRGIRDKASEKRQGPYPDGMSMEEFAAHKVEQERRSHGND